MVNSQETALTRCLPFFYACAEQSQFGADDGLSYKLRALLRKTLLKKGPPQTPPRKLLTLFGRGQTSL
ncbi:hypothetical protein RASY3_12360 [Ruminococcus albus SY3]|uniref:Uncharacterized protein n=1 Tax=Ruminococcus albus SY3 TaxID=1341156 RepID=A0A011VV98_RUMAL|nr:hypothetical protein RASY3_12360 [Ruminococcus albus SY3]